MIMTSSITTAWCGVCGKSIGNGVDIFVHFFTTPMSILNLTMSSESHENGVSNDILSERKCSQLFTHELNIFLLKQLYQFTDAAQRWRHSLFKDCSQTDERKIKHHMISCQFHSVHLADIIKRIYDSKVKTTSWKCFYNAIIGYVLEMCVMLPE